ncbi:SLC40A1 (predicted) [Pycnogonum litorale]
MESCDDKKDNGCFAGIKEVHFKAYCSRALTSWGDRMWLFAIGIFMVRLEEDSLRLAATYGALSSVAVIILGEPIGDWVDRTDRLTAARIALFSQNTFVAFCAIVLCLVLTYEEFLIEAWDGGAMIVGKIIVIFIAILVKLASFTSSLIIEKDWIVELAEREPKRLATLNATFRRIDLTSLVTAPAAVGQIMTYTSLVTSAIFLAGWNVLSMFVEYWLLWNIYKNVPGLHSKEKTAQPSNTNDGSEFVEIEMNERDQDNATGDRSSSTNAKDDGRKKINDGDSEDGATDVEEIRPEVKQEEKGDGHYCKFITTTVKKFVHGWKVYFEQDVLFAGLALAALYMTVLGFDSITVGYAYLQGISESFMGWMSALSAVFGIAGTITFPYLRNKFGLKSTGTIGFVALVTCLSLCVISVWVPGSPLDLSWSQSGNDSASAPNNTDAYNETTNSENISRYESIGLLLTGVIIARYGLWTIDLTTTQLFQENVQEIERGVVGGVQKSLEEAMDVLKFITVLIIPGAKTFGILIIISFAFICSGFCSYLVFATNKCSYFRKRPKCGQNETDKRKDSEVDAGIANEAVVI